MKHQFKSHHRVESAQTSQKYMVRRSHVMTRRTLFYLSALSALSGDLVCEKLRFYLQEVGDKFLSLLLTQCTRICFSPLVKLCVQCPLCAAFCCSKQFLHTAHERERFITTHRLLSDFRSYCFLYCWLTKGSLLLTDFRSYLFQIYCTMFDFTFQIYILLLSATVLTARPLLFSKSRNVLIEKLAAFW